MVKFSYKITAKGWSEAIISSDEEQATLSASYISDALGPLVSAVVSIMQLANTARCTWAEEPGKYCWIFEKQHDDLIIKIFWFDNSSTGKYRSDEQGILVFSTQCKLLQFAIQLRGQLRQLLNELGFEKYKEQWGHNFPHSDYEDLEKLILTKKMDEV